MILVHTSWNLHTLEIKQRMDIMMIYINTQSLFWWGWKSIWYPCHLFHTEASYLLFSCLFHMKLHMIYFFIFHEHNQLHCNPEWSAKAEHGSSINCFAQQTSIFQKPNNDKSCQKYQNSHIDSFKAMIFRRICSKRNFVVFFRINRIPKQVFAFD